MTPAELAAQYGASVDVDPAELAAKYGATVQPAERAPEVDSGPSVGGVASKLWNDTSHAGAHLMELLSGHPVDDIHDALVESTAARRAHWQRAVEAYKAGDYKTAIDQGFFGSVPFLGPALGAAADEYTRKGGDKDQATASAIETLVPALLDPAMEALDSAPAAAIKNGTVRAAKATANAASATKDLAADAIAGTAKGINSRLGQIVDKGVEGAGLGFVGGGPVGAAKVGVMKFLAESGKAAIEGMRDQRALRRWNEGVDASRAAAADTAAPSSIAASAPAIPVDRKPEYLRVPGANSPVRPPLAQPGALHYQPPAGLDTSAVPVAQAPAGPPPRPAAAVDPAQVGARVAPAPGPNNLPQVAAAAQASTLEPTPPAGAPPATEPASPMTRPDARSIAQRLFEEGQRSGTVPPEANAGEPFGGNPPENPQGFQQRARGKRATDAETVAQMFHEAEIPSENLGKVTMEQWRQVAAKAGVEFPKTAEAIRKLVFEATKKLQGMEGVAQ